jgi:hypothetical protein
MNSNSAYHYQRSVKEGVEISILIVVIVKLSIDPGAPWGCSATGNFVYNQT